MIAQTLRVSSVTFIVLIIAAMMLVGGIVLVVALIRSQSQGARVVGWILLTLGLIMPLFLVLFSVSWVTVTSESTAGPGNVSSSLAQPAGDSPPFAPVLDEALTTIPSGFQAAWLPQVDEEFDADVYPSQLAAARKLTRQAVQSIQTLQSEGEIVAKHFDVRLKGPNIQGVEVSSEVQSEVSSGLLTAFPNSTLQSDASATSSTTQKDDGNLIAIELSLPAWQHSVAQTSDIVGPLSSVPELVSGTLAMKIELASPVIRTARFVEKPWVESLQRFESKQSDGRQWLVARSPSFASSEGHARRLALTAAEGMFVGSKNNSVIANAIRSGDLVTDRFTQRLSRPYGDVWREAILVDVTPQRLASLYQRAEAMEARAFSTMAGRLIGFAVIMAVATLLYFVFNAVTRGYHRLPVGLVVGTLAALIAFAVMLA